MTFPHAGQEPERREAQDGEVIGMVHWTCPECPRSVYSRANNPKQLPCGEIPWHRCQSKVIEGRLCGESA